MLFSNLNEIGFLIFEKKGEEKFSQIEDNSRNTHPILEKIAHAQHHKNIPLEFTQVSKKSVS